MTVPRSCLSSSGTVTGMNPTRSANSTVTTLRSSQAAGPAAASAAPHSEQNFAPAWLPYPHEGQMLTCKAYGQPSP
jgi:hypothetical protein